MIRYSQTQPTSQERERSTIDIDRNSHTSRTPRPPRPNPPRHPQRPIQNAPPRLPLQRHLLLLLLSPITIPIPNPIRAIARPPRRRRGRNHPAGPDDIVVAILPRARQQRDLLAERGPLDQVLELDVEAFAFEEGGQGREADEVAAELVEGGVEVHQRRRRGGRGGEDHPPGAGQHIGEVGDVALREAPEHGLEGRVVRLEDVRVLVGERPRGRRGEGEGRVRDGGEDVARVRGEGLGERAEEVEGRFDELGHDGAVVHEAHADLHRVVGLGGRHDRDVGQGVPRGQAADFVLGPVEAEGRVLGEVLVLDEGGEVGPFGPVGTVLDDLPEAERLKGHAGDLLVLDAAQEVQGRPGGVDGDSYGEDVEAWADDALDAFYGDVAAADEVAEDNVRATGELGESRRPSRFEDGGRGDVSGCEGR